ncbi:MAG: hypothetical protein ACAI35_05985 [Candidatus Methylacidiphilales bacterium]|nr:hypothetical protein [Candidatus Methylacidiphilales bacterium]
MEIPALGELSFNEEFRQYESEPVAIPMFDGLELPFTISIGEGEEVDIPLLKEAVEAFLKMGTEAKLYATPYIFKYYKYCEKRAPELVYEDLGCHITEADQVWEFVQPGSIDVTSDRAYLQGNATPKVYVSVAAWCGWEIEHGLQLVYRHGSTLSRVSEQDGHFTHVYASEEDGIIVEE